MEERNLGVQARSIQNTHNLKSSSSDFGDDDFDNDLLALVDSSTQPIMYSAQEDDAALNNHAPEQPLALAHIDLKEEPTYEQPSLNDDDDDEFDDDVEFGEGMEELLTQYEKQAPAIQKQALPQSRDLGHKQPMMKVQPDTIMRNANVLDENSFSDDEFQDNDLDLDNVLQELEHQSEVGFP
jgi:DNA replication ATP-dependent helicase Dna2